MSKQDERRARYYERELQRHRWNYWECSWHHDIRNLNDLWYRLQKKDICEDWRKGFINFFNYAICSGWSDDLTISRIDINKDYCPDNCIWRPKKIPKIKIEKSKQEKEIIIKLVKYKPDKRISKSKRLRRIWYGMNRRCYNPNHDHFYRYGGRGITICDLWRYDYFQFETWALHNGYADSLTIDRVNNDGNYQPLNCRWVTIQENNKNRPTTRRGKGKKQKQPTI